MPLRLLEDGGGDKRRSRSRVSRNLFQNRNSEAKAETREEQVEEDFRKNENKK